MTRHTYPWLHTDPEGRHRVHAGDGMFYVAHRDGMLTYHDQEWASRPVARFRSQAEAVAHALRQVDGAMPKKAVAPRTPVITEDEARNALDMLKVVDAWLFCQEEGKEKPFMGFVLDAEGAMAAMIACIWPEDQGEPMREDNDDVKF